MAKWTAFLFILKFHAGTITMLLDTHLILLRRLTLKSSNLRVLILNDLFKVLLPFFKSFDLVKAALLLFYEIFRTLFRLLELFVEHLLLSFELLNA